MRKPSAKTGPRVRVHGHALIVRQAHPRRSVDTSTIFSVGIHTPPPSRSSMVPPGIIFVHRRRYTRAPCSRVAPRQCFSACPAVTRARIVRGTITELGRAHSTTIIGSSDRGRGGSVICRVGREEGSGGDLGGGCVMDATAAMLAKLLHSAQTTAADGGTCVGSAFLCGRLGWDVGLDRRLP